MEVKKQDLMVQHESQREGISRAELREPLTGLCVNCDNADSCNMRLGQKKAILDCEEHEVEEKKVEESSKESSDVVAETDGGGLHFKGLCANCENREYCVFSDDSIGVWHCAEYR